MSSALIANRVASRAPGPGFAGEFIVRSFLSSPASVAPSAVEASCGRWLIHAMTSSWAARRCVLDVSRARHAPKELRVLSLARVRALFDVDGRVAKEVTARA